MKISELVARLQSIQERLGDLSVFHEGDGGYCLTNQVDIEVNGIGSEDPAVILWSDA